MYTHVVERIVPKLLCPITWIEKKVMFLSPAEIHWWHKFVRANTALCLAETGETVKSFWDRDMMEPGLC